MWQSRATQPQPQPGEEARESRIQPRMKAGLSMGCWQKAGPACQATMVLLEQTAVGRVGGCEEVCGKRHSRS